ncbi:MAG TPA: hypothetical protein DEB46_02060 [Myxococcales bacterium]|nr:hypothetical protein [Myxococcales bacterium]HBU47072.1 hypothetical protein [Myxococcales bacterium]
MQLPSIEKTPQSQTKQWAAENPTPRTTVGLRDGWLVFRIVVVRFQIHTVDIRHRSSPLFL